MSAEGSWDRYHVAKENTFLNISPPLLDLSDGWIRRRRSISDPLPPGNSRSSSAGASETSQRSGNSTLALLDQTLFGFRMQEEDNKGVAGVGAADHDGELGTDGASAAEEVTRRTKSKRMNKSKRVRYRLLIERLEKRIQDNPESFDPDKVEWPPGVASNEKLKSSMTERLQKYKETVTLQRLEQRDPGANSSGQDAASSGTYGARATSAPEVSAPASAPAASAPAASVPVASGPTASAPAANAPAACALATSTMVASAPAASAAATIRDTRPRTRIPAPKKMLL